MNYEQKLKVGKLVKMLMELNGRNAVFQNIYKTGTRSVKCYRPDAATEVAMCDTIRRTLNALKVPSYTIRTTKGSRWGGPALIVKF